MVPRPYCARETTAEIAERVTLIATREALMEALGRELWLAADELIAASAGLAEIQGAKMLKRAWCPMALANGGLQLRRAAEKLTEGTWEGVKQDMDDAGNALHVYIPYDLWKGPCDLFAYYVPMPNSEWAEASECLANIASSLTCSCDRIREESLINFRDVACSSLAKATGAFKRASKLLEAGTERYTPIDPRKIRCPQARGCDEEFYGNLSGVRDEALAVLVADSPCRHVIEQITKQLQTLRQRQGDHRNTRRSLLQELSREYFYSQYPPDWDHTCFLNHIFVQRLMGYDGGLVSPNLEMVKEQLRGMGNCKREVRKAMLREFEVQFSPDRHPGREDEVISAFRYVQRLLEDAEPLPPRESTLDQVLALTPSAFTDSPSFGLPKTALKLKDKDLDRWLRRRVFELRVNRPVSELQKVLHNDDRLVPPFTELKRRLGMQEDKPLPASLEQLVTEFRQISPPVKLKGADLDRWLRRRAFELRVDRPLAEVQQAFQNVDDDKLAPPFSALKQQLGMQIYETLPMPLEQLATEYRAVR